VTGDVRRGLGNGGAAVVGGATGHEVAAALDPDEADTAGGPFGGDRGGALGLGLHGLRSVRSGGAWLGLRGGQRSSGHAGSDHHQRKPLGEELHVVSFRQVCAMRHPRRVVPVTVGTGVPCRKEPAGNPSVAERSTGGRPVHTEARLRASAADDTRLWFVGLEWWIN
jgi:hypothetical protein